MRLRVAKRHLHHIGRLKRFRKGLYFKAWDKVTAWQSKWFGRREREYTAPEALVGALQDCIHHELGVIRPARSVKQGG